MRRLSLLVAVALGIDLAIVALAFALPNRAVTAGRLPSGIAVNPAR